MPGPEPINEMKRRQNFQQRKQKNFVPAGCRVWRSYSFDIKLLLSLFPILHSVYLISSLFIFFSFLFFFVFIFCGITTAAFSHFFSPPPNKLKPRTFLFLCSFQNDDTLRYFCYTRKVIIVCCCCC